MSGLSTKFVFVTGGVVSGLGKGICAASLGRLLKQRGVRVRNQKFDPYINVDPGTMSPYQHGEVFVTEDGAETEAEQIDQETELEDVEEFQNDEEFDPSDDETDLEEAYEGFFAEEGPDGEGETSLDGEDGGLAAVASQAAGIDLSEEGFHIVDGDEADEEAQLYENGSLDSYDADALNEDGDATAGSVPEVDEANALEELEDGQDDDVQDVVIIEPSAEDDGYGDKLLERLELDDKRKKLGRELSKGMQQKLSICCALVHRPRVLIFDEPLVGLDPHAIKELKTIFRELRAEGRAVLISTHMIESVEDYWDVAHIMMSGRFAATKRNTPEDTASQSLEDLFFEITEGGERA